MVLVAKNRSANARDLRETASIPGSGGSPGGGNGNSSILALDRGAWQATVSGVTNSQTQLKRLCTHALFRSDGKTKGLKGDFLFCFLLFCFSTKAVVR